MMLAKLPIEFNTVINRLREKDWLITCYDTEKFDIYNPWIYYFNQYNYGIKYKIVIDRNIFQYIMSSPGYN